MEFFLVPLLAIAGVTVGINKLAGLCFHIRLSWKLLAMLVGFAWLISLVLPGMFFHSAGFAGSVGISLVCAVGFAWLATVYDARTHAVQSDTVSLDSHDAPGELNWTPAAENAFPVVPDFVSQQKEQVLEIAVQEHTPAEPVKLPVHLAPVGENVGQALEEAVLPIQAAETLSLSEAEEYIPVSTEDSIPIHIAKIPEKPLTEAMIQPPTAMAVEAVTDMPVRMPEETLEGPMIQSPPAAMAVETVTDMPVRMPEETLEGPMIQPSAVMAVETVAGTQASMPEETLEGPMIQSPSAVMAVETLTDMPVRMPEEMTGDVFEEPGGLVLEAAAGKDTIEPMPVEAPNQQVFPTIAEQPASDSLEDLLEFAFEQRSCRNISGALDAFRLIRLQYGDSDAVALVSAELVSTLQSCGDYDGAMTELDQALHLPLVQRDNRMVQAFAQKKKYLQALQDLLREQGKPNLPFEQIPAEWSDWLEKKLSAGPSTQS